VYPLWQYTLPQVLSTGLNAAVEGFFALSDSIGASGS
jgi:hypothetical protein